MSQPWLGGCELRNAVKHQGLVKVIAQDFASPYRDMDDLIGAGNLGLVRAMKTIRSYPKQVQTAYIATAIKRSIIKHLYRTRYEIEIPGKIQKLARKIVDGKMQIEEVDEKDRHLVKDAVALIRAQIVQLHDADEDVSDKEYDEIDAFPLLFSTTDEEALAIEYRFGLDGSSERSYDLVSALMGEEKFNFHKTYGLVRSGLRKIEAKLKGRPSRESYFPPESEIPKLILRAKSLRGLERRLFMGRTAKAMGFGGIEWANKHLGWNRETVRKGINEAGRLMD